MVAGGSILQCLVPIISIFIFYRQRDFFAISISFGWLSTNLFYIATYIADSRSMSLPLVSPFGCEPLHDWNYILGKMGMLNYDTALASFIRLMAIVSMLICLVYGGWLVWLMLKSFRFFTGEFFRYFEIETDGITDVFNRFLAGLSL